MKIIIKESTIVYPAQSMPNKRLWLSNLDVFQTRNHVPTLFLYKPTCSENFIDANVLKEALSKVLVPFYPVAGRFARDENGRLEIDCNGKGVLFTEAETDRSIGDIGDFMFMSNAEMKQLIPTVDFSSDVSSYPLLIVQITRFKCGKVCIGAGFHHTVGDGFIAAKFFNTWSELSRGHFSIPSLYLDRIILRSRVPPTPKFPHIEYHNSQSSNQLLSEPTTYAVLEITRQQLDTLKAKTNKESIMSNYSTYEVLAAHIWRCVCKARGLPDDEAIKLYISVDGRSRFNPPLPFNYLGNVVFFATPIALSGELLSEPTINTVERIHKAIKRMDDEYLRSAIDYLEVGDIESMRNAPQASRFYPNLKIISWMRMPFYQVDFGWGKPLYFRATNPGEGKAHIIPSPRNDGSMLLAICLETNHMQSFQKLFYGGFDI